jgi:hypothetical protein
LPWWDDATVDFMTSGGYKIAPLIRKVYAIFYVFLWSLGFVPFETDE